MYGTNIVLKIKCVPKRKRSSLISEYRSARVKIETILDNTTEVNSIDITCFRSHFLLGKTFIL